MKNFFQSNYFLYGLLGITVLATLSLFFLPAPGKSQDISGEHANNSAGTAEAAGHDETKSDGRQGANQDIGEIVDLTSQTTVAMDIKDFKYARPNIKIKKGTTVTWTNRDTVEHNVMLEHPGGGAAHDAPKPNEIKPDVFAGPLLAQGESYSFTFNETGTDPYHCSPHPFMKGSVTVVE